MKTPIHLCFFLLISLFTQAQITTPVIKAGFGVDGELRTNYYNGFVTSGNDDWFFYTGTPGTGQFVIDTTGAAAMVSRYLVDPNFRRLPFYRTMRVPQLSVVNKRLWIDAVYIRDYNGQAGGDSTAFVSSNKNGQSPQVWGGGVTSVLDKNDISDMMVHVRRAGPYKTDELWFFGGVSLQGTVGNRYFDFELYQTDIFYSRQTGQFSNYGPDEGHTSWQFDAAGNITKPGDVIFTAEFDNSSLSFLEARVWVHKSALSINPTAFDWGGNFDGGTPSSIYGYANIRPKTTGDYYSGLQSGNGTWAGPFGFINSGNNYLTTYSSRQFMEFSVNLTKLGLDPITLLGGSACGLPFRRILVKTRSSTAFTAELKDFIGPFDFFTAPPVQAAADIPYYCGPIGVSNLRVTNALEASVYKWSTLDGHFVYDSVGPNVVVDKPGTYVVTQQLLDGCSDFAKDTLVILHDSACVTMENNLLNFSGSVYQKQAKLNWNTTYNNKTESFVVQRSLDGKIFTNAGTVASSASEQNYMFTEGIESYKTPYVYYRLLIKATNGSARYSQVIRISTASTGIQSKVGLFPNPATNYLLVSIPSKKTEEVRISVVNSAGVQVHTDQYTLAQGDNTFTIEEVAKWPSGMYLLGIHGENGVEWHKFVVSTRPTRDR